MAGVGDRVELVVAPAEETLSQLDEQVDFAFIDILQPRTVCDLLFPWLSPNGLIVVDNLSYETADTAFLADLKADFQIKTVTVNIGGGVAIIQPVGV